MKRRTTTSQDDIKPVCHPEATRLRFEAVECGPLFRVEHNPARPFSTDPKDGTKTVIFNCSHPFYDVYDGISDQTKLKTAFELFVMSFAGFFEGLIDRERRFGLAERRYFSDRLRYALDALASTPEHVAEMESRQAELDDAEDECHERERREEGE